MRLGRVVGTAVSTIKVGTLTGHKLLLVADMESAAPQQGAGSGRVYVAIDRAGAGEGDIVLVAFGTAARIGEGVSGVPTDASVVGIIDSLTVEGRTTFAKQ